MPRAKSYALPKRFSAALSEPAYDTLRRLNQRYHLSNNYLLTVLLEHLDSIADDDALDEAYRKFINRYGAPSGAGMGKTGKQ